MVRAISIATIAAILLFSAGSAQAQYYGWGGGWGGGWGWGNNGAGSTVAGSQAMGMADLVQSAGAYNLQTSAAAINLEQARSMNLDNRLKGTQTYFEMRRINTEARRSEQRRPLTTEEAWRYAQIGAPKRTTPYELDPVSGKIFWPMALQNPQYTEFRNELDDLFRQREEAHGSIGYDVFTKIQEQTTAFLEALKKNIAEIPSGEYMRARNFIESLAYEARFPTA